MRCPARSGRTRTSASTWTGCAVTFIVQNQTPHCGIINARALVLEWLDAVVIRRMQPATGWYGFITTAPSETETCPDPRPALVLPSCHSTVDTWGNANWMISSATVDRGQRPPRTMVSAGWLPTPSFARRWRAFVSQPAHPLTSNRDARRQQALEAPCRWCPS
jgi:hypothetical protein